MSALYLHDSKVAGVCTIVGRASDRSILVNDCPLSPVASQRVYNHSPDGFAWGYCGSGPAQLALALLLALGVPQPIAMGLYHDFKREHVAAWPVGDDFAVAVDLAAWVAAKLEARRRRAENDL